MFWTVFPENYPEEYESLYAPQDFETFQEAVEYAESLEDCDYTIEQAC